MASLSAFGDANEETKQSVVSSKFNFAAAYLQSNDVPSGPDQFPAQHASIQHNLAPTKMLSERRPNPLSMVGGPRRPGSSVANSQPATIPISS